MDNLLGVFQTINGFLWTNFLMFLLVGTGIYFTIRLKFVQVKRIGESFKLVFGGLKFGQKADKEGMSSFQSLATAIAGQVGTGNIAAPATAIMAGGPGAIFWMWVSAFFGMGTIFAEATAAQKYKITREDGSVIGGPATYIQAVFKGTFGKVLAAAFSIFVILGFGMAAAMIQGSTIGDSLNNAFGINKTMSGIFVSILVLVVVLGGIKRIASLMEKAVPVMAVAYILAGLAVIIINIDSVGYALQQIFVGAFNPQAVGGGAIGITIQKAMRYGVARGLFSNEAGMGTTPHAHAVAKVKHPAQQGVVAMMSIFIDTFIILTITAIAILSSGVLESGQQGIGVAQLAFSSVFGSFGSAFIAIVIFFFSFTTIIAAYFYGEMNYKKLFGDKTLGIYMALIIGFVMLGTSLQVSLVWEMTDTFNGFMVFTNLIGLLGVSGVVAKVYKDYEENKYKLGILEKKVG